MTTKWQDTRAGKRFLAAHGHKKRVKMTWLARARILSGFTTKEAAWFCDLNPRSWEAWERIGRARATPSRLYAQIVAQQHWEGGALHVDQLLGTPYVTVNPATLEVIA